jgi:hypothetical protein
MYCMALKVYTCQEAASGPKTFLNIFCKLLQQNEPSPAWQWSWFQYQLTLLYTAHVYRDDVTLDLGRYYIYDPIQLGYAAKCPNESKMLAHFRVANLEHLYPQMLRFCRSFGESGTI